MLVVADIEDMTEELVVDVELVVDFWDDAVELEVDVEDLLEV